MQQTLVHNVCEYNWGKAKTIALPDGKGYITIQYANGGNCAYVCDLAVVPSLRGKGVGKELLDEAKRDIRSNGWTWARLKVERDKERLIKWYKRQGWDEIRYGTDEGIGTDDEEYVHMFIQITFPKVYD